MSAIAPPPLPGKPARTPAAGFVDVLGKLSLLLAVVVGVLAGLGAYLFEMLLHGIKSGLIRWFPVDSAHILFLIYPAVGIILATLFVKYIVRDNISEGVTRVLYAMSRRNSRIARQ